MKKIEWKNKEFPVMHFTPQDLLRMHEEYIKSPRAYIRPTIPYKGLPGERFDLLEYFPYIPDERQQGCGDCWVWACTGALEIDRAVRTGVKERLSVQWFNSKYGRSCCGGYPTWFADFFGKPYGRHHAIPWSNTNAYYHEHHDKDECPSSVSPEDIAKYPDYPIDYCKAQVVSTTEVGKEVAIANIKNVLKQKKAVVFEFFMNEMGWNNLYDFWANRDEASVWNFDSSYDFNILGIGHDVLCIGYDDTDPNKRYWIMVNSWQIKPTENSPNLYRPNNFLFVSMDMNYDCMKQHTDTSDPGGSIFNYAFQWWTFEVGTEEPKDLAYVTKSHVELRTVFGLVMWIWVLVLSALLLTPKGSWCIKCGATIDIPGYIGDWPVFLIAIGGIFISGIGLVIEIRNL
jgi:hypothetical protein